MVKEEVMDEDRGPTIILGEETLARLIKDDQPDQKEEEPPSEVCCSQGGK